MFTSYVHQRIALLGTPHPVAGPSRRLFANSCGSSNMTDYGDSPNKPTSTGDQSLRSLVGSPSLTLVSRLLDYPKIGYEHWLVYLLVQCLSTGLITGYWYFFQPPFCHLAWGSRHVVPKLVTEPCPGDCVRFRWSRGASLANKRQDCGEHHHPVGCKLRPVNGDKQSVQGHVGSHQDVRHYRDAREASMERYPSHHPSSR